MNGVPSTDVLEPPAPVDFEVVGLGTMRSTGTLVALLLMVEDHYMRISILVDVAKSMQISLAELTDTYADKPCPQCGNSLLAHRYTGGQCL